MRFPFFRNRDSVKNGILISIRRTGDGFHPGLFRIRMPEPKMDIGFLYFKFYKIRNFMEEHREKNIQKSVNDY